MEEDEEDDEEEEEEEDEDEAGQSWRSRSSSVWRACSSTVCWLARSQLQLHDELDEDEEEPNELDAEAVDDEPPVDELGSSANTSTGIPSPPVVAAS